MTRGNWLTQPSRNTPHSNFPTAANRGCNTLKMSAQIIRSPLLLIVYRTISYKQINTVHATSSTHATIRITRITFSVVANFDISFT
jgi:hypothetical protein